ncbi:hypothetical protein CRX72_13520 [Pantoea sp. BRM17]|nr:hypothetical protein CRX72_13520 [Pantoea sp. BRM17]
MLKSGQSFENPIAWGVDLSSEHERYLAEKHFKAPVVVKNYPKDIKAFYMRMNDDGKTVAVWMLEPEVAFATLDDAAALAEAMLKYVFKAVLNERADDMAFFAERVDKDAIARLERFVTTDFAQVD